MLPVTELVTEVQRLLLRAEQEPTLMHGPHRAEQVQQQADCVRALIPAQSVLLWDVQSQKHSPLLNHRQLQLHNRR